jgi:hypothetical protein
LIEAGVPSRTVTVQVTDWPGMHEPEPDDAESTSRLLSMMSVICTVTSVVLVVRMPMLKVKRAPGDDSATEALLLIRTLPGTWVGVVVALGADVLVGVLVAPGMGVLVGVLVAPGMGVLVGVLVAPGMGVLVGVLVAPTGVSVGPGVGVSVAGAAVLVKPWATVGSNSGVLVGSGGVVATGSGVGAAAGCSTGCSDGCSAGCASVVSS